MRWWPWTRKARRRAVAREWQQAERQQRAEYDAAVRRILEAGWNAPTSRFPTAPLLTRGQIVRANRGGPR